MWTQKPIKNLPQIEASFDKINPTVRHIPKPDPASRRGQAVYRLACGGTTAAVRLSAQETAERRPPTTEGMLCYARHSLGSLPLITFTPPPEAGQGPARPRWGRAGSF